MRVLLLVKDADKMKDYEETVDGQLQQGDFVAIRCPKEDSDPFWMAGEGDKTY